MSSSGHRQVEHTADLALALWARSEEDLLREGARAIVEVLTERTSKTSEPPASRGEREVELETLDGGDRLVQWLNAILVLALGEGFLFTGADIELRDGGLSATVHGEEGAHHRVVHELKSTTYHELKLERGNDGTWEALVVIDV